MSMPLGMPAPPKTEVRTFVLGGLAVVLLLFGGLGSWAAIAPLSGAVIAPGTSPARFAGLPLTSTDSLPVDP